MTPYTSLEPLFLIRHYVGSLEIAPLTVIVSDEKGRTLRQGGWRIFQTGEYRREFESRPGLPAN